MTAKSRFPSLTAGRINRSWSVPEAVWSWRFVNAKAEEATRLCASMAAAAGEDARLRADAYLMGGEL